MKIKSLKLSNFAKYDEIEVNFDDNVTYLIGPNKAGKSTLGITAIHFMFCGIAEKGKDVLIGDRFRFIGPLGATSKNELILYDEKTKAEIKVIRKLTKQGSELYFEGPEGVQLDQEWLTNLFNVFLIAPAKFVQLSPKDQSLLLGINTETHDAKIKTLKSEYTLLNRDYTNFGEINPIEKTEKVDVLKLTKEKQDIITFNEAQEAKQLKINQADWSINGIDEVDWQGTKIHKDGLKDQKGKLEAEIEALKVRISGIDVKIKQTEEYKATLPKPEQKKPLTEIDLKIKTSQETNEKATKYEKYLEDIEKKSAKKKELDANKEKQKTAEQERLNYITSKKLPFKNLSINEEGELLLDGKLIKEPYFSTGELIKIVPILMSSQNPELKYVFIQNFNMLDQANQKQIEEYLVSKNFQLVIELVGESAIPDKRCILLKDCKVVSDDTTTDNGPSLTI